MQALLKEFLVLQKAPVFFSMRYTKFLALIGIALFLYILFSIGPIAVVESLVKLDLFLFAFVVMLLPPILLLKGFKQQILVNCLHKKISLAESTKIWLIGFFFATITPAKAGDFLRALYLRNSVGLNFGAGLVVTAVERIFDLLFLFLAALLGLIVFSLHYGIDKSIVFVLSFFLIIFLIGLFVLTRKKWVAFLLKPVFNFLLPEKFREKSRVGFDDFYGAMQAMVKRKKLIAAVAALTIGSWLLIIVQFFLIAASLHLPVSFQFILSVMPAILLIEVLPISFAGIGTRDATAIFFLSFAAVSAAESVSFSLTILAMNLLTALIGVIFLSSSKAISTDKQINNFP